jgi:TolB-like protein/Flp pilus assembly protein TadD
VPSQDDEGRLVIDRALAHYRITAAIGSGGMGEVYRATDNKLGREVALKVLPAGMAANADRLERFRREAKALAALDHPGIVTVFSVEEADGVHFLTMQLIEGQALDSAIPEGGMPVQRLLDIAGTLADALAAAHDRGIIHRDLKPANVMITSDGRVKVLDFGLAKELRGADPMDVTLASSPHTEVGVVMGTPAYMSPEQVVGAPLDHRTDIFSLGVLLYEMVTGRRPFQGRSSAETTSAILRDTPAAVTEVRADVPGDLARIIRRCLEKDPRHRIQTARDVANELKELRAESGSMAPQDSRGVIRATGPASGQSSGTLETGRGDVPWIAVLPLKAPGSDPELAAFADGLGEDITTGLSGFPHLHVISRHSALQYAGRTPDVRAVGRELGARYALEGAVRKAGSAVRVSVQLLDTSSGTHMWAETYDRDLAGAGIFKLQDDITDRVVATVADPYGVLVRSMALAVRDRPVEELSARELALRCAAYWHHIRPDEHARLRAALERTLEREPMHAEACACLSRLYSQEHAFRLNPLPDSVERAREAARRAVEIDPICQLGWEALAEASYFARDLGTFRNAAERAMALNPRNTSALAFMGVLISHGGEWDRGVEIMQRSMELNPHHPGWYHFPRFFDHYRKREFDLALAATKRMNMPEDFWTHAVTAAASGRLGRKEEARAALDALRSLMPGYREELGPTLGRWILDAAVVEQVMEGLAEAEALVGAPPRIAPAPPSPSGATRADEGFWVAVLPFRHRGAGLEALAEGLTEDIVTGLSRFSYVRVVSRGATSRYAHAAADAGAVGKEIGARYVMEGSLGHAGGQLRVAVQLVDASTGAHLWAETYTRPFEPDHIFAIQDDLVPRIVSTTADHFGVLARSISDAVREKPLDRLSPYEALMRGFGYHFRLTPEEHAAARGALERAVERAPANADCWAMLSWVYSHEHAHGFNPRPGSLDRALAAARRAVDLAPSNHVAQQALAVALFFRRDIAGCRSAAERALALNPLDGSNEAIFLVTFTGDWDRGCRLIRWAMDQNPHHPRWYGLILAVNEYRVANYRGALDEAVKANMPDGPWKTAVLAAAYGQLGDVEAARAALRTLPASEADFARSARGLLEKWLEPQLVDHLVEGLRKAGLGSDADRLVPAPSAALATAPVSIAVLPFADLSPARDQEYLCEGMAEEVMHALVRVDGIRVASRASAFRASTEGKDVPELARALSVSHVLQGSVRTAGSRLRVTAQLTDVASGFQLWSERFDREAGDVFAMQDEIAAGVVEAVKARLAPGRHAIVPRPQPRNLEAYRHYLLGRHLRFTKNDPGGAARSYEQAIGLDPAHAPSWVGLAEVKVLGAFYLLLPTSEAHAQARDALATAARLQGETATALYVEGMIAFSERDWPNAERMFRRALELEPHHVPALCWLAVLFSVLGRPDDAASPLQLARDVDPLAPFPLAMAGMSLLASRRVREAERYLAQASDFEKDNTLALWASGLALMTRGQAAEGIERLTRALTPSHRGGFIHAVLGWAFAVAGRVDQARAILAELRMTGAEPSANVAEAWLLAALGEADGAWAILDRAEQTCQQALPLVGLTGFDPLRRDPRFAAMLERLGLPAGFAAFPPGWGK